MTNTPELGRDAQFRGRIAEERVINIASDLGLEVITNPDEDYGNKTDCIINGIRFQVSCSGKSNGEKKRLNKRGISSIVAGKETSDEDILGQIFSALNSTDNI